MLDSLTQQVLMNNQTFILALVLAMLSGLSLRVMLSLVKQRCVSTYHHTIDQDIEYIQASNKKESFFKNLDSEIAIEVKANNQVSIGYLSKMFPFERLKFSKYSRAMRSIS